MVTWNENLYIGQSIKKYRRIMHSIDHGKLTMNIFCIMIASNPENLFDIIAANELFFPHYKHSRIHIVGLARGREEAIELVQEMLMDVFKDTGAFGVREYFST